MLAARSPSTSAELGGCPSMEIACCMGREMAAAELRVNKCILCLFIVCFQSCCKQRVMRVLTRISVCVNKEVLLMGILKAVWRYELLQISRIRRVSISVFSGYGYGYVVGSIPSEQLMRVRNYSIASLNVS